MTPLGRAVAFTISGTTKLPYGRRRQASLTWNDDGTVSGDSRLLLEVERLVATGERVKATPTGPSCEAALQPREAAAILLASLFQSFGWTGDFPEELLYVEPGAVS